MDMDRQQDILCDQKQLGEPNLLACRGHPVPVMPDKEFLKQDPGLWQYPRQQAEEKHCLQERHRIELGCLAATPQQPRSKHCGSRVSLDNWPWQEQKHRPKVCQMQLWAGGEQTLQEQQSTVRKPASWNNEEEQLQAPIPTHKGSLPNSPEDVFVQQWLRVQEEEMKHMQWIDAELMQMQQQWQARMLKHLQHQRVQNQLRTHQMFQQQEDWSHRLPRKQRLTSKNIARLQRELEEQVEKDASEMQASPKDPIKSRRPWRRVQSHQQSRSPWSVWPTWPARSLWPNWSTSMQKFHGVHSTQADAAIGPQPDAMRRL